MEAMISVAIVLVLFYHVVVVSEICVEKRIGFVTTMVITILFPLAWANKLYWVTVKAIPINFLKSLPKHLVGFKKYYSK